MGTKNMGSKGGNGGVPDSKMHSLPRQGSFYSLTLDEFHNQLGDLGKPLSSMNLDELLRAAGMGFMDDDDITASSQTAALDSTLSLHRQASLLLSRDISKKTVDEVWREIQTQQHGETDNNDNSERSVHERQATLGTITLEDFLVKAGISIPIPQHDNGIVAQPPQWMQFQQQPQSNMMGVYMPGIPGGGTHCMDVTYPEMENVLSVSDPQTPRQKRIAPVEKTVERRQKRMIKNRESAARSRARKQAYTHELENKISHLEEENERLKKLKEVENLILPAQTPEPKQQLRRTSSAPL